jgi:hypothetical protein
MGAPGLMTAGLRTTGLGEAIIGLADNQGLETTLGDDSQGELAMALVRPIQNVPPSSSSPMIDASRMLESWFMVGPQASGTPRDEPCYPNVRLSLQLSNLNVLS